MNDETEIELPRALVERLRQQDRTIRALTPQVDRKVIAAAQSQFAERNATQTVPHTAHQASAWGIAAAAAAALAFVVVTLRDPQLPGDYDGSGSVNVLDAFALSRELSENPQFAANDTVDSLMNRIVALDGGLQ